MAVALNDPINGSFRKLVNQFGDLISVAGLLGSLVCSDVIGRVLWAIITDMGDYNHCVCSLFSQLFGLSNNNVRVVSELVGWEKFGDKPRSCGGSLHSREPNNSNFDAV